MTAATGMSLKDSCKKRMTMETHHTNIQTYTNYTTLFEQVQGYAIIMMDTEGNIQDWNKGAEKIKGYTTQEIIGKNFRSFYTEEDRKNKKPDRLLKTAAREGCAYDEGWRVRKDGTRFWGSVTITALYDESDRLMGYGKVTRDLTEKKELESELREQARQLREKNRELKSSEMRFRHMMQEVQDYAIFLMDEDGNIRNWNKGAEKIKGYAADEIIGKNFRNFYPENDRETGLPDKLLNIARTEGRAQDEGWRVRKDGSHFWASVTITALHDDQGKLMGFSKVTRDLTERKAAEEEREEYARQLEDKNEELEQFALNAAHDLREPLHNINTFIHHFKKAYLQNLDEKASDYLEIIDSATQRMRNLLQDLLEYARLGSNRSLTTVDTRQLLEEVSEDLRSRINETGTTLKLENLPVVQAYENELRVLFQNLIVNAIKFRRPGSAPQIKVSARKEGSHWKFAVQDNGIGIAPEDRDKIFQVFKRLHNDSEYSGSGIGLAHCRKIVGLHGGNIWVESVPGEGSTFYFSIATKNLEKKKARTTSD